MIKNERVAMEDVISITSVRQWFVVGAGKSHKVNPDVGEQGRSGQVVAWCGYGTVTPTWEDEPSDPCKSCLATHHRAGCNGRLRVKMSGMSCQCGATWECW